jgi:hypothetical protein
MSTIPFFPRLRADAAPTAVIDVRRPFRLWMTGSLAVVMAALGPMCVAEASARGGSLRLLRHSRFDVPETVLRIESAARNRGLSVLARVSGARPVIVLASKVGGTLVVMHKADSQPAAPMSMLVRAVEGGGADVLVASHLLGEPADWLDLPAVVAEDLAALPGMVALALA